MEQEKAPWDNPENEIAPWETEKEIAPLDEKQQEKMSFGDYLSKAISELGNQPLKLPGEIIDPEMLVPGFIAGVEKIDRFTGAPIRKFTTELATGKKLDKAPSGREQAEMMGVPSQTYGQVYGLPSYLGGNISPSDIAGVGLEIIQDPTVLAEGLIKGGKSVAGMFTSKGATKEAPLLTKATSSLDIADESLSKAKSQAGAETKVDLSGGDLSFEQKGKLFEKAPPKNLDELISWEPKGTGELPSYNRLREIQEIVPDLETKPLEYHYKMLENPKAMKELKLQFENLPETGAKKIAAYNQQMLNESLEKSKDTVFKITGSDPVNLSDAGEKFINATKNKYNAEKELLGPKFQQIKEIAMPLNKNQALQFQMDLISNSKIQDLAFIDKKTNKVKFAPFDSTMGLSKQEYNELKDVLSVYDKPITFKQIQNQREYLRKLIDPANPKATEELSKLRGVMLDKLEQMSDAIPEMRDTFKQYAINERSREQLEKIIGGKVESFDEMFRANPEKVVNKIFSNPNYVDVAQKYLGQDVLNEMIQSKINDGLSSSISKVDGFKPHEFKTWLAKNDQFLTNYAPEIKERLNALADSGTLSKRFLAEVNPSGTAASLLEAINPTDIATSIQQKGIKGAIESKISSAVASKVKSKKAIKAFNESMGEIPVAKPSSFENFQNNLSNINLSDMQKAQAASRISKESFKQLLQSRYGKQEDQQDQKPNIDKTAILNKVKGSKYESLLNNALQNGGEQSFAAANYVLKNRDKNYRQLFDEESE